MHSWTRCRNRLRATAALPDGFVRRDAACRIYGLGASLCCAQGDGMGAPSRILVQLPAASPSPDSRGGAAVDEQPWVGGRFGWSGAHVASLNTATAGGPGAAILSHLLEPLRRCLQPSPPLPAAAAPCAAKSETDGSKAQAPLRSDEAPSSYDAADKQPRPPHDSQAGLAWYALALIAGGLALLYRQAGR